MTVQEAISLGQELRGEGSDTDAAGSPRAWTYLLRTALNEVGQAADAFYYSYETDLVSGTALYCASPLYKINAVQVCDSSGVYRDIPTATARQLREWFDPNADASKSAGTPSVYAQEGANRVILWPTPNYSTTGVPGNANAVPPTAPSGYGLIVEGWAKPGDAWILNPGGVSDMATACPLDSENAQMAAVYRAMELRDKQFKDWASAAANHADYVYKKGMYESEVATKTHADRRRLGDRAGASGTRGAISPVLGYDPLGE